MIVRKHFLTFNEHKKTRNNGNKWSMHIAQEARNREIRRNELKDKNRIYWTGG